MAFNAAPNDKNIARMWTKHVTEFQKLLKPGIAKYAMILAI